MIPGEVITAEGEIILNEGKELTTVSVANIGDRPIQIGSHYHFYEANEGLIFDRDKTYARSVVDRPISLDGQGR